MSAAQRLSSLRSGAHPIRDVGMTLLLCDDRDTDIEFNLYINKFDSTIHCFSFVRLGSFPKPPATKKCIIHFDSGPAGEM